MKSNKKANTESQNYLKNQKSFPSLNYLPEKSA